MNKSILFSALLLSAALVVSAYLSAPPRYQLAGVTSAGQNIEIDTRTGEMWTVLWQASASGTENDWYKAAIAESKKDLPKPTENKIESQPVPQDQELPPEELSKLALDPLRGGSAQFSGNCYNGSTWIITRLILTVTATNADGSAIWTRDFECDFSHGQMFGRVINPLISPLSTTTINVNGGDVIYPKVAWKIKKAYGRKEPNL